MPNWVYQQVMEKKWLFEMKLWMLHVDGSTNEKESDTNIILEGLGNLLVEQSLYFNSKCPIIKLSMKNSLLT